MTMLVYRVEHKIKYYGPYCSTIKIPQIDSKHPCIHEEMSYGSYEYKLLEKFKNKHPYCFRYGFETLPKLTNWFSLKTRRKLKKQDYVINVYKISENHVFMANKQLIFSITHAKLQYSIDLSTLKIISN